MRYSRFVFYGYLCTGNLYADLIICLTMLNNEVRINSQYQTLYFERSSRELRERVQGPARLEDFSHDSLSCPRECTTRLLSAPGVFEPRNNRRPSRSRPVDGADLSANRLCIITAQMYILREDNVDASREADNLRHGNYRFGCFQRVKPSEIISL